MNRKVLIIVASVLAILVIAWVIYGTMHKNDEANYQFREITRGDLESTISATGTLSPVTTVEIGTQVSGTISRIYVDFNDQVKKGQCLAELDTVLLKTSVLDAQASMDKAQAQLEQAQADFERNKQLYEQKLISDAEFLPFQIALKMQKANLISARAALQRARRNLQYAVILSPISGTVIQRNVEAGQTVAASFSTPTLFKIAENLSQIEILAEVDEGDIGQIKVGQTVRFDVQAYPDKIFTGVVKQIRLEPTTISNVVTYTVVISAANEGNILLPGMTATIDFIIEQKNDVMLVPNIALRFQPDEKTQAEFRKNWQKTMASLPDSLRKRRRAQMENHNFSRNGNQQIGSSMTGSRRPKDLSQVWYLDQNHKLAMEMVRIGMSDGTNTEILRSKNLKEGMKVITGMETVNSTRTTLQNPRPGFGGGRSLF